MKERRTGLGGVVGGLADSVAGAVRRRQQDREPRAVVHDAAGHAQVVPSGAEGREELLDVAERLISLAEPEPDPARQPEDAE